MSHRRDWGTHKPQPSEPRHYHTLSHLTAVVPAETVGCSSVTGWRRLRDWTGAGVWPRLHRSLLTELRRADSLDLDDCAVDGSHVRALKGGTPSAPRPSTAPAPAPSPT